MNEKIVKCTRCGWTWIWRKEGQPIRCAQCKSPYWHKPLQRPKISANMKKYWKNKGGK